MSLTLWLAHRFVAPIGRRAAILLAAAPLLLTGKAILFGRLYGPADLYYGGEPWSRIASEQGVARIANPILSDLAFANLPWRAAVREALANGRFPFWNRFVLGGTPLLATAQAAIFRSRSFYPLSRRSFSFVTFGSRPSPPPWARRDGVSRPTWSSGMAGACGLRPARCRFFSWGCAESRGGSLEAPA